MLGDVEYLLLEQVTADCQQDARERIRAADHHPAANHIEQPPQQQRATEVAQSKRQDVPADTLRRHVIEVGQHQRIGKENRVIEKCLRCEQGQADQCALAMNHEQAGEYFIEWRMVARVEPQWFFGDRRDDNTAVVVVLFDVLDDAPSFFGPVMNDQPAWAFRHPQAHQHDHQA